jgi:hypothetical protein
VEYVYNMFYALIDFHIERAGISFALRLAGRSGANAGSILETSGRLELGPASCSPSDLIISVSRLPDLQDAFFCCSQNTIHILAPIKQSCLYALNASGGVQGRGITCTFYRILSFVFGRSGARTMFYSWEERCMPTFIRY